MEEISEARSPWNGSRHCKREVIPESKGITNTFFPIKIACTNWNFTLHSLYLPDRQKRPVSSQFLLTTSCMRKTEIVSNKQGLLCTVTYFLIIKAFALAA